MSDFKDVSERNLDALLRSRFPGPVPDDGFSERVMRALPRNRQPRIPLLPLSAAAGTVLAWFALLPSPIWRQVVQEWLAGSIGFATVGISALLLGMAIVSCAWSLEEG